MQILILVVLVPIYIVPGTGPAVLSKYCMKRLNPDNEFDCVQYHINAEYCYFYSLYFLYVVITFFNLLT